MPRTPEICSTILSSQTTALSSAFVSDTERQTRERLLLEIKRLEKRATIDLLLGIFIAMIASIGFFVMRQFDLKGISLFFLVHVSAFFFLLYKKDLADIKYYQNEITNVEMRMMALKTFLSIEQRGLPKQDKEILKTVVAALVGTERNFKLRNGETTVELEKSKQEVFDTHNLAARIINTLKPKS